MIVLVELFGTKFKVTMKTNDFEQAKYQIMGKIKFTEIKEPLQDNDIVDYFNKNIFK